MALLNELIEPMQNDADKALVFRDVLAQAQAKMEEEKEKKETVPEGKVLDMESPR